MSSGKVVLGVLAGVAVGATLGILFAPDKGSKTRRKIYDKGDDYVGALEDKFNSFVDGLSQQFEAVKEESRQMVHHGKEKADGVLSGDNVFER